MFKAIVSLLFETMFLQKTRRSEHPWMEIYIEDEIHFIGIGGNHEAFVVPEAREFERRQERK